MPGGTRIIDGDGGHLLPGLAEMHAHIPGRGQGDQWLDDVLLLYLANGITTARGMLVEPSHLALRDAVAGYERLGPGIYTSGPSLNGDSVSGSEDADRQVREQAAAGSCSVRTPRRCSTCPGRRSTTRSRRWKPRG